MVKLLEQIQSDITAPLPISDVLRKALILARRLKNKEFIDWVDHELHGYYGSDVDIPDYRILQVSSFGDFFNGVYYHRNNPMPVEIFPQDIRDTLTRAIMRQSVREIESMIESIAAGSQHGYLMEPWPPAAIEYVSKHITETYSCISAWRAITREALHHILDTVRTRLLEFTINLSEEYPEAAGFDFLAPAVNPPNDQVSQPFFVNVFGNNNTVGSGNTNSARSETTTMNEVNIGDGNTFEGDFVVANSIAQSFNRVTSSKLPDAMKDLLKQLTSAVSEMSKELSPEIAQQVASDLETLTKEATSKAPRQQWIQLSGEGLVKAAKNIGAIGAPVIVLVEKLLPLLTG